jgi:hypothetical protein
MNPDSQGDGASSPLSAGPQDGLTDDDEEYMDRDSALDNASSSA